MLNRFATLAFSAILVVTANPVAGQMSLRLAPSRPALLFDLAGNPLSAEWPSLSNGVAISSARNHRVRNAVIGGLIGAATGVIACTVISNIANDPGTGTSTCDTKAYIGFALGGAALGALIGAVIK